ncbi:MAG: lipoate protein ligase C-terminal domain-containing protein [Candidatus Hecatellaceae archaeon]
MPLNGECELEVYRHTVHRSPGGKTIRVCISTAGGRISRVVFTGDFFAEPPESLTELGESLRGLKLEDEEAVAEVISKFFSRGQIWLLGVTPADFKEAVIKGLRSLRATLKH